MANWMIGLFSKYNTNGHRSTMAVADSYPNAERSDACGQSDAVIKARSAAFCTLVLGKVNDALLATINADSHYMVLARYEADVDTPSFDNRSSAVTNAQKNAFVAYFSAEFGIDVSKIPVISGAVGRTRMQVLRDIVQDMRALR